MLRSKPSLQTTQPAHHSRGKKLGRVGDQPSWDERRQGPGTCSEASALLSYDSQRPGACKGQSKERALVFGYPSSCCFSVLQWEELSHGGHSDLSKLWEQQGLCLDVGKG